MDLNSKKRLRTTVLLLILCRIIDTKGSGHNLNCVNDYVSIINCTLQSNLPTNDSSKRLTFQHEDEEEEPFSCPLSRDNDRFLCSVVIRDGFVDADVYTISLCQEGEICEPLEQKYKPFVNIKPKPPTNLTGEHNSSHHRFSWKSTYEEEINFTNLPQELQYQLLFCQKEQPPDGTQHCVPAGSDRTTLLVKDEDFEPDSEFVVKVRSRPNEAFFKGHWSDWSPEVHWRTAPKGDELNPLDFDLKKLLIPLCVLVPVFLCLSFASVRKWRQRVFIPTPEPYFHSLYGDCQGDFKSWVIMEKTVDLPMTEKTSRIEKLVEMEDIHEVAPSLPQGSEYANMSGAQCALPELGLQHAENTSGLDSATASCTSGCLSPQSRSPTEGDSGCWLSSDRSLERGQLWYCNDYCTLSTFQQSALGTDREALKCGTCKIVGHDAIQEIHSI